MQPTLAGFLTFLRKVAGIPVGVLPDNSPTIPIALALVLASIVGYLLLGFNFGIDFTGGTLIDVSYQTGQASQAAITAAGTHDESGPVGFVLGCGQGE